MESWEVVPESSKKRVLASSFWHLEMIFLILRDCGNSVSNVLAIYVMCWLIIGSEPVTLAYIIITLAQLALTCYNKTITGSLLVFVLKTFSKGFQK